MLDGWPRPPVWLPAPPNSKHLMQRSTIVTLVVAAAFFMENLDSAVIATSLPAIGADLGVDPVVLKLAFTAYLLSLAVLIPVSGWCADRFGVRLVFRAAIVVFMLGSIGCAMAVSLPMLVVARLVQGAGGALMVPIGRLVVLRLADKSELVNALAWLSIPALVGPLLGPPIGGFITTYFDWRWIFWINLPIGLIGLVLGGRYIPEMRSSLPPNLDAKGFLISGVALTLLITGATLAGGALAPWPLTIALIVAGGALVVLYVRHARTLAEPLLDLRLLAIPTYRTSVMGGFFFRIGVGAIPFLLPLMLQLGFGFTAFESGMLTFLASGGALLMKAAAAPILRRFGFRRVLIANAVASAISIGVYALFTATTPYWLMALTLLIGGFLRSLQFTSLNAIAFADIDQARMSRATSLAAVSQQLSLSAGVTLAALVLEVLREARGTVAITAGDFSTAFWVVAIVAAASAILHLQIPTDAGAELVGRKPPPPAAAG